MIAYQKQFERVKRFFARIQNQNRSQIEYEDDIWSFFIHAWSLKDWLKNFIKQNSQNYELMNMVEKYDNLKICHDIATFEKHYELGNKKRLDGSMRPGYKTAKYSGKDVELTLGQGNPKFKYKYKIKDEDENEYFVSDLAKNVINDWQTVIRDFEKIYKK